MHNGHPRVIQSQRFKHQSQARTRMWESDFYWWSVATSVLSWTVSEIRRLQGWKCQLFSHAFIKPVLFWTLDEWSLAKSRVLGLSIDEDVMILAQLLLLFCHCCCRSCRCRIVVVVVGVIVVVVSSTNDSVFISPALLPQFNAAFSSFECLIMLNKTVAILSGVFACADCSVLSTPTANRPTECTPEPDFTYSEIGSAIQRSPEVCYIRLLCHRPAEEAEPFTFYCAMMIHRTQCQHYHYGVLRLLLLLLLLLVKLYYYYLPGIKMCKRFGKPEPHGQKHKSITVI